MSPLKAHSNLTALATRALPLLLVAALGCQTSSPSAPAPEPAPSAKSAEMQQTIGTASPAATQETFSSPENAAAALKQAVRDKDRAQLLQIFGPDGEALIFSGDRVQDDNKMSAFEQHMSEQLRVDHPSADKAVLYIGANNWPFPIPVVSAGGQWHFDTAAGKDEILNRRIGQNEFSTIDVCRAFVRAQKEYESKPRSDDNVLQYARHFRSTAGKHDGLYWDVSGSDDFSPMGDLVAGAEAEGYSSHPLKGKREPYHGYYFHILTAQGPDAPGGKMDYLVNDKLIKGFALIAYPDERGNSGVMTFIVNQDGKVYQKDLGPKTAELAPKITEYNPDSTWQEVKD